MLENIRDKKSQVNLKDDLARDIVKCFDNPSGKRVLEYLEDRVERGYPDWTNPNIMYGMAGARNLIKHIRIIIKKAKSTVKGGGSKNGNNEAKSVGQRGSAFQSK